MRVIERDGLVAALVSSAVCEDRFVKAYEASLVSSSNADDSNASRNRVLALKQALGDLHAECGAFAVVAFDVSAGRVLAARTANAAPLHYGFTQDGALVACGGLTARRLFPDAGDAALRLTPLPSGRFVFGHRFVKPIEFTRFWDTALSNRAAAPARDASCVSDAAFEAGGADVVGCDASFRRRWGATGSAADGERRWNRDVAAVPSVTPSTLNRAPSAGAYVPPSLRKKREAEAAAKAAETVATTERPVSPRSAARIVERDAQVATALAAQDAVVLSLGDALVAAVAKAPKAHTSSLRRAGLRSNTFTLGRVPGAGAEKRSVGVSGLSELKTASFRVDSTSCATKSSVSCADAEAGFASFKANFERMAAMHRTTAA